MLVDPTPDSSHVYVYGTYFGDLRRTAITDGGPASSRNAFIQNGINLTDRSEFYVPWVLNQNNPNQLFVGTYRLYRTDDAKAARPQLERRSAPT